MTAKIDHHLHRRAVLAGFGAALAAPFLPTLTFAAAPYRRKLGSIELTAVSDGTLNIPLSFLLPDTPPAEAAALLASHGLPAGGAPLQTNITLVQSGVELILIDAGSGTNFQETAGKLAENLEAAGIDAAKISKVIFTHAHADHLWGAIDDFDNSERFPNASYVISAAEWDFWTAPDISIRVLEWQQGIARGNARVLKRLEKKIERRNPGDMVAPGLTFVDTSGHSPGHVAVMIESGRERLLVGGDVFLNPAISFAKPEWRFGNDYDRDRAAATRKRLLDQLAADRIPLIGYHLPWPGHGMVERQGTAYRFVPL